MLLIYLTGFVLFALLARAAVRRQPNPTQTSDVLVIFVLAAAWPLTLVAVFVAATWRTIGQRR